MVKGWARRMGGEDPTQFPSRRCVCVWGNSRADVCVCVLCKDLGASITHSLSSNVTHCGRRQTQTWGELSPPPLLPTAPWTRGPSATAGLSPPPPYFICFPLPGLMNKIVCIYFKHSPTLPLLKTFRGSI